MLARLANRAPKGLANSATKPRLATSTEQFSRANLRGTVRSFASTVLGSSSSGSASLNIHNWALVLGVGAACAATWRFWSEENAFEVRADSTEELSPQEIAKKVHEAAKAGNAEAQYDYAVILYRGEGVAQNFKDAVVWFEKAAAGGVAEAKYNLGVLYLTGHRVKQDIPKAVALLEDAAQLGVVQAAERLGTIYNPDSKIPFVTTSHRKSRQWFQKAADLGSIEGAFMTGAMAGSGRGGSLDEALSLKYFISAGERGHAASACNVAMMYHNGVGTPANLLQAFHWYREAAQLGDMDALTYLSLFHLYGVDGITPRNVSLALKQLQLASVQHSSLAQRTLAALYLGRNEFGADIANSVSKAIDDVSKSGVDVFGNNIGTSSKNTPVNIPHPDSKATVPIDFTKAKSSDMASRRAVAYQLFAECARHDVNDCRSELASMIIAAGPEPSVAQSEGGITEPRHAGNLNLAYKLVSKAAEEGHENSIVKKSVMLYRGIGTTENHVASANALLTASRENSTAQYLLGAAYINGDGIDKSWTTGMIHMNASSIQAYVPARKFTESMDYNPHANHHALLADLESLRDSLLQVPEPPMKL